MGNAFITFKMEKYKRMKILKMVKSMVNVSVIIKMDKYIQKKNMKMQNWMGKVFGILKMVRYRVKANMKMEMESMFFMTSMEISLLSVKWKKGDVF